MGRATWPSIWCRRRLSASTMRSRFSMSSPSRWRRCGVKCSARCCRTASKPLSWSARHGGRRHESNECKRPQPPLRRISLCCNGPRCLPTSAPGTPTVVEIAPEFVAVSRAGCVLTAEPRLGDSAEVARTVADGVDATSAVLVDAPVGVDGALALAGAIVACLRTRRVAVTMVHQDRVLSAVRDRPTPPTRSIESPRRR